MEDSVIVQFSFLKKIERDFGLSFPNFHQLWYIMDHGLTHIYSVFQKRAREGKKKERKKKDKDLPFKSEGK
jgi:hypothetical protein